MRRREPFGWLEEDPLTRMMAKILYTSGTYHDRPIHLRLKGKLNLSFLFFDLASITLVLLYRYDRFVSWSLGCFIAGLCRFKNLSTATLEACK